VSQGNDSRQDPINRIRNFLFHHARDLPCLLQVTNDIPPNAESARAGGRQKRSTFNA
jgi:hypothetical protein